MCVYVCAGVYVYLHKSRVRGFLTGATTVSTSSSRETYDNAHFYILFVMFFYSFLAMTLFKCFIDSDEEKKDPYEEFIKTGQPSTQMGGNIEKCGSMAGRNLLL
uniref:Uncharacterized protein n=1 Tax=Neolamprologus brichardi TaxID=32507 RepID=A0A3Q4HXC7_NEOBR